MEEYVGQTFVDLRKNYRKMELVYSSTAKTVSEDYLMVQDVKYVQITNMYLQMGSNV